MVVALEKLAISITSALDLGAVDLQATNMMRNKKIRLLFMYIPF
jgi:hypothetical protein